MISTLGTDPEIILVKNNKPHSAEGLVGGSKKEPMEVNQNLHVQEDGVLLEFNIRPAGYKGIFESSIGEAINTIKKMMETKGYQLSTLSAAKFPKKQLETDQAQTVGCDPDLSAWTLKWNEPWGLTNERYAGGHIHVGISQWEKENGPPVHEIVKWMDLTIGCRSVLYESATRRKLTYGQPGLFRPKPYGFEYRTPSNQWIFAKWSRELIWNQVDNAMELCRKNGPIESDSTLGKDIRKCIITHDVQLARTLMDWIERTASKRKAS